MKSVFSFRFYGDINELLEPGTRNIIIINTISV